MDQRELEIIMRFPQAVHTSMRKMLSGFSPSRLDPKPNPTLGRTLMFLYDKGPLTMTELHHCLGLEKGSMTPVVDRLVDLQLVERNSVAGDRRKVNIVLTALGRETAEVLKVEIAEFIRKKLNKLTPGDRERFYHAIEILSDISRKL